MTGVPRPTVALSAYTVSLLPDFEAVQRAVQDVLQRHLADGADHQDATIADRGLVLLQAARARQLRTLAAAFPDHED